MNFAEKRLYLQPKFCFVMHNDNTYALRQHIIAVALKGFHQYGIRQLTMDQLAHEMGMSKRTLYEIFAGKEELLMACIEANEARHREQREHLLASTNNVLEFVLGDLSYCLQHYHHQSLAFIADLARYPAVVAHVERYREVHCSEAIAFLQRGVEQGVFRSEINYEVYFNLVFRQMDMLATQPYFRALPMKDIFLNVTVVNLRGCCTDKGNRMIDEFLRSREVYCPEQNNSMNNFENLTNN